ncbi:putative eukaryotic initiation factor-4E [Toxoplasma gondii ARI]|uniref:Putative eukaryotic initiation factor-4E n=1 Tax=Toxoplasma gondii ARI TaxID=1074872 RepID=A0A139XMZ8_TOXGO|nr:putative eukaryotic initiation factor-4E [Toxoplasma gondii ARI]
MKEAVAVPLASVEEKERQKLQKKEETEKEVEEKKARKKKEILAEDALEEKASWRADPVAAPRPRKASDTPPTSPTVAWSSPKAELKKERKLPKNVPSPVLAAKKFGGRERGALPGRQSHGQIRVKKQNVPAGEHALETGWRFWYYDPAQAVMENLRDATLAAFPETTRVYASRLRGLSCFSTVEGFFRYMRCLARPSQLPGECLLQLFRKGCWPLWEFFPSGGSWSLRVKKPGCSARTVDGLWETLVLACIGETFEMPEVVGVVVQSKAKEFVLSLWIDSCPNAEAQKRIGEKLDQLCRIRGNLSFQFKSFQMVLKNCGAPPSSPSPAKTPAASPPPSPFLLAASFASLGSSALSPAVRPGIFSLLKASGEKSADRLVLEPRADDATQEKENGDSSEEESTAQPPEGKQETAANRENEKSKETGKKKATKAPGGGGEAEEAPEKKNPREA